MSGSSSSRAVVASMLGEKKYNSDSFAPFYCADHRTALSKKHPLKIKPTSEFKKTKPEIDLPLKLLGNVGELDYGQDALLQYANSTDAPIDIVDPNNTLISLADSALAFSTSRTIENLLALKRAKLQFETERTNMLSEENIKRITEISKSKFNQKEMVDTIISCADNIINHIQLILEDESIKPIITVSSPSSSSSAASSSNSAPPPSSLRQRC